MPADQAFLSARLPAVLRDRLKAFAVAQGQSVQEVVQRAVTRLLDEEACEPPALAMVVRKLRDAETEWRREGVTALWVFGSVARGEAGSGSDIDLAVELDPSSRPTLFTLAHLQEVAQARLGTRVDLGLRRSLRPGVLENFERDAVRVF